MILKLTVSRILAHKAQIRVNLSEYSNWPTIPQLFVKGELVGGCDIVMELESKGEL